MPAFDDSYHMTWTKADRRRIKRDRAMAEKAVNPTYAGRRVASRLRMTTRES